MVKGTRGGGPGDRACLTRAVASLLKGELKEAFLDDALEAVPAGNGVCPVDLAPVLARHGLALTRASTDYFPAGGPPWQQVLEDEHCSIVLSMCLDGWQSHFVCYDGSIIHDAPHNLKISKADRSNKESSRAAFDKLYHDHGSWTISSVYRLTKGISRQCGAKQS